MLEGKTTTKTVAAYIPTLIGKGIGAIADQGLFASSNFLFNLLLVRLLPPKEYGIFTIAYSAILLLGTIHTAVVIEPMLVFGAGKYSKDLKPYVLFLLNLHAGFSAILLLLIGIISITLWISELHELAMLIFVTTASGLMVLFLWLIRRLYYIKMHFQYSAVGGLAYAVILLGGVAVVHMMGLLTPIASMLILGSASALIGFLLLLVFLRSTDTSECQILLPRQAWADHWSYARWSIPGSVFMWIPGNLYYVLLPVWSGLELSGILKAMMNLIMPALQINTALAMLFIPFFSRAKKRGYIKKAITSSLLIATGISVIYWIIISVCSTTLLLHIYGEYYVKYAQYLYILGTVPIFTGVIAVLGAYLRAEIKPRAIFWAYSSASLVSTLLGLTYLAKLGIYGGALGTLFNYLVITLFLAWYTYKGTTNNGG